MHTLDQDNHVESLVGFKSSTDLYILYVYVNTNTYTDTPFSNHFIMFSRYGMDVLSQIFSQAVCFSLPHITSAAVFKSSPRKNTNVAFTKQHQRFHNTNGCRISTRCPTQHQRFRRSRGIDREASRPPTRNDQEPNLEESCWVGLAVKKLVCWKNDHQMFRGLVFRVEEWLKLVCWKSMDV